MARKTVKQKAIEHYERMIEYAKKYESQDAQLMISEMMDDIKECTGRRDCSYCIKNQFNILFTNEACGKCKLNVKTKNDDFNCCNGLYLKMTESKTTKTWIARAEKVKQYIIDNG